MLSQNLVNVIRFWYAGQWHNQKSVENWHFRNCITSLVYRKSKKTLCRKFSFHMFVKLRNQCQRGRKRHLPSKRVSSKSSAAISSRQLGVVYCSARCAKAMLLPINTCNTGGKDHSVRFTRQKEKPTSSRVQMLLTEPVKSDTVRAKRLKSTTCAPLWYVQIHLSGNCRMINSERS